MVWLKLRHPSGKITLKKFKTKAKGPEHIKLDYYGTAHHFNTEASVRQVYKKKPKRFRR